MASSAPTPARTPEATEPTSPSTSAVSRPAAQLTVLTTRDEFLLELGEALAGQASVHPVESIEAAIEMLTSAKRGHVLVLDTRDLSELRASVDRVHARAPQAVILVFAPAESEKQTAADLKGSNVFAVLPIPLDIRKSGAVLEGALSDALTRKSARQSEALAPLSVELHAPQTTPVPARAAAASPKPPVSTNRRVLIGAVAGVVALVVAATLWLTGKKPEPAVAPVGKSAGVAAPAKAPAASPQEELPPPPVADTALVQGKVDDLLEKARLSMRERKYTEPAGDNALLYYRSAAAADPLNAEAVDGMQRVAAVLVTRFEEAMTGGRYDEAAGALANFKLASPKDPRVSGLELRLVTAQINKALNDGNADRAAALVRAAQQSGAIPADQLARWRTDIGRRQEDAKVQRLVGLVSDHIRDGKLVEPANDSAKDYLVQLKEQAPGNPATQRVARDLNNAYLRKAREATLANRTSEADRWIGEAKAGGMSTVEIAAWQRDLSSARQKAAAAESDRLAQLIRDRLRDGRLTDPTQDSAGYYLGQLQAGDAAYSGLAGLSHDFAARLLERARSAAQNGKSPQIDADLATAKRWGADPKDIAAVQQVESASKTASANGGRSGGADAASLAASLKRVRYVAPEYPDKALSQKVAGVVMVEFMVDLNGYTRDVRVIESTPPGVFDRAAISAIKRWRYEPGILDGAPVEVPFKTSIRFELPH